MSLVDVSTAVELLARGELVAIPTETVYGLAGDATNPRAIEAIFATKGRPSNHPLIMHLGAAHWASQWGQLPSTFLALAQRYWPGPLTLVVPKTEAVAAAVTGGQDSVALRVPDHPLTLQVLQRLGTPLVAPSANRFGHTSPTRPEHVLQEFPELAVLDGGPCRVGLESTILDLTSELPRLLRPGQIGRDELASFLGGLAGDAAGAPRVPGALERHYAPRTRTVWWHEGLRTPERWAWLGFSSRNAPLEIVMPNEPHAYARQLYAALRQLDAGGAELIAVEAPPRGPQWEAVWDRLQRATHSSADVPRKEN